MTSHASDSVPADNGRGVGFLGKCRYSLEPIAEYRALAAKALAVSFLPGVALAVGHWYGGGWPEAFALMTMHIAVWGICVTVLPGMVAMKHLEREAQ